MKPVKKTVEVDVEIDADDIAEAGWTEAPEPDDLADFLRSLLVGDLAMAGALSGRVFADERSLAICGRVLSESSFRRAA